MAKRHKLKLDWVLCPRCRTRRGGSAATCEKCGGPTIGRLDDQPRTNYEFRPRR